MLGLIFGALMFAQCINPNLSIEVCGTPTEMPTLAPTETPEVVPTETPTPAPTDTPQPTETPTPRPTLAPTETPEPRATPTLRPTPELPGRTRRPTLEPGPERAKLPECLAAPPAVPDVPGIRDASWTNAQRCGGTPEALATRAVVDRPERPAQTPEPDSPRLVLVVPVVILPPIVVTETPTSELMIRRSDEMPADDNEAPRVPVQLPEGGDS